MKTLSVVMLMTYFSWRNLMRPPKWRHILSWCFITW